MANLQKYRTHESLNMESAAQWRSQNAITVDSDGVAVTVSQQGVNTIHLQSDNDFYFKFNTTGTSSGINTSNDLYLKGGDNINSIKVPKGMGDTVYLIMERKGSSDATVRLILA